MHKESRMVSASNSEDMDTEPLDRTKDVLEELRDKVLLKYPEELAEVNEADETAFKLKAG